LLPEDIDKIYDALGYKERRKIIRYLKEQGATQEENAKTRREIISYIGLSDQQTIEHCDKLINIGVVFEIRGPNPPPEKWGGDVIKYYLVIKRLIEVLAIIVATILTLQKAPAEKINRSISRIFNDSNYGQGTRTKPGTSYAGTAYDSSAYSAYIRALNDYQEQSLQTTKEIADNYIEVQKALIDFFPKSWQGWWSSYIPLYTNRGNNTNEIFYDYYWFLPKNIVNVYTNAANLYTDYLNSTARLAINNTLSNMEASKILMQQAGENAKQLSHMVVNTVKMFEPIYESSMPVKQITIPPQMESAYDLTKLEELRHELGEILQLSVEL
jgi:predicted transcriptional regulator